MKILLNGTPLTTDAAYIRDLSPAESCVITANGFAADKNRALAEGDEIYIIPRGVMPSEDALCAMMSARHTPGVAAALKKGSAAIAGLGGLGSNIAVALARIGVGRLRLVDFDIVEPSNLNRQSYYIRHLGMYKTDALSEQLSQINPYITVDTVCERVTEDNIERIFSGFDAVCEAFDGAEAKAMLVNGVLSRIPDAYIVSASGMAGFGDSNSIKTRSLGSRLFICGDGESEAREGRGLMAPRVMICAGHQANKVLELLFEKYGSKDE